MIYYNINYKLIFIHTFIQSVWKQHFYYYPVNGFTLVCVALKNIQTIEFLLFKLYLSKIIVCIYFDIAYLTTSFYLKLLFLYKLL